MKCRKSEYLYRGSLGNLHHLFQPKSLFRISSLHTINSSMVILGWDADCCNFVLLHVLYYIRLIFPTTSAHYQRSIQTQVYKGRVRPKRYITGIDSGHKKPCQLQTGPSLLHLPYAATVNRLKVKNEITRIRIVEKKKNKTSC